MKNADKAYLDRVAHLGCALCNHLGFGDTPPEIHHLREGQGMSQRASNYLVIPLCPEHHRGAHGIHGDRKSFKLAGVDEMHLLAWVIEQLNS